MAPVGTREGATLAEVHKAFERLGDGSCLLPDARDFKARQGINKMESRVTAVFKAARLNSSLVNPSIIAEIQPLSPPGQAR